jgi:hypothetical protein
MLLLFGRYQLPLSVEFHQHNSRGFKESNGVNTVKSCGMEVCKDGFHETQKGVKQNPKSYPQTSNCIGAYSRVRQEHLTFFEI